MIAIAFLAVSTLTRTPAPLPWLVLAIVAILALSHSLGTPPDAGDEPALLTLFAVGLTTASLLLSAGAIVLGQFLRRRRIAPYAKAATQQAGVWRPTPRKPKP